MLKTVNNIPLWFLIVFEAAFAFAFYKVGPVEAEPEGNALLGSFLLLGGAALFIKLFKLGK